MSCVPLPVQLTVSPVPRPCASQMPRESSLLEMVLSPEPTREVLAPRRRLLSEVMPASMFVRVLLTVGLVVLAVWMSEMSSDSSEEQPENISVKLVPLVDDQEAVPVMVVRFWQPLNMREKSVVSPKDRPVLSKSMRAV